MAVDSNGWLIYHGAFNDKSLAAGRGYDLPAYP